MALPKWRQWYCVCVCGLPCIQHAFCALRASLALADSIHSICLLHISSAAVPRCVACVAGGRQLMIPDDGGDGFVRGVA